MAFLGRKVIFRDMKGQNLLCNNPVTKNKEILFLSPPVRRKTVQEIILTEEESEDLNRYVKKHTRVQLGWVGRHSSPSRSFTNKTWHNNQGEATWVFTPQQFIMKIAKCVNIIYKYTYIHMCTYVYTYGEKKSDSYTLSFMCIISF